MTNDLGISHVPMILVGIGAAGQSHLLASFAVANVSIVGLVDIDEARTADWSEKSGIPKYQNIKQAASATSARAAIICTPTGTHATMIQECLETNLHVLCEKPMAADFADALESTLLAKEKRFLLSTAHLLRFCPEYEWAETAIKSKQFGLLTAATFQRQSSQPATNTWVMHEENGGGAALDIMIHDMEFLIRSIGVPSTINMNRENPAYDPCKRITASLRYDNLTVSLSASFAMPNSFLFRARYQLEFENALVEYDSWKPTQFPITVYPQDGSSYQPTIQLVNPYSRQLEAFANDVSQGLHDSDFNASALEAVRLCGLAFQR